ncbi:dephospho-CoA kinase [Ceratobasidium sp. AG-Ba]|nr:dephospho-CoA kinase [Ceratobasidium sp. AG-Ba]
MCGVLGARDSLPEAEPYCHRYRRLSPRAMAGLAGILSTYLFHMIASRNLTFAGYVVLLYDHLLTLGDEVSRPDISSLWDLLDDRGFYVDRANLVATRKRSVDHFPDEPLSGLGPLSPLRIVIISSADKGGLARNLTVRFCRTWFLTDAYYNFVLLASIHALMVMRVNAFWGNSPNLRRWLIGAFVLYLTSTLGVLTSALHGTVVTVCLILLGATRNTPDSYVLGTDRRLHVDNLDTGDITRSGCCLGDPFPRLSFGNPPVHDIYTNSYTGLATISLTNRSDSASLGKNLVSRRISIFHRYRVVFVFPVVRMGQGTDVSGDHAKVYHYGDYKHYGFPDNPQHPSI